MRRISALAGRLLCQEAPAWFESKMMDSKGQDSGWRLKLLLRAEQIFEVCHLRRSYYRLRTESSNRGRARPPKFAVHSRRGNHIPGRIGPDYSPTKKIKTGTDEWNLPVLLGVPPSFWRRLHFRTASIPTGFRRLHEVRRNRALLDSYRTANIGQRTSVVLSSLHCGRTGSAEIKSPHVVGKDEKARTPLKRRTLQ
jgi:hypothetical protein